jgi:hypothetical protein
MAKNDDLGQLTREQKLELLDLLEEKKRRKLESRAAFKPHAGQLPICKSDKYIRAVVCSNSFGKTALCVNEALWAALGYNPVKEESTYVPAHVVVVLDKPEKVSDPWLKEMKKWIHLREDQLHKKGKPYISEISFDNGSTISFMFHEMGELSFESISDISAIVMDEMPPRHAFVALTRGQRDRHLEPWVLIASTMISTSWVYKDLYIPWSRGEREDVEFFSGTIWQNEKNLADGYIDRFSRNLTDKERLVRLEGKFADIDGLALAHLFKQDTHVIPQPKWPENWPVVIAIDPAMRKPHVAIMLGVTPDDDLIYLKELRLKSAAREFGAALKTFYDGYRVMDIVCDSMGSGDLTGGDGILSFIKVLQECGVRVRPTTYNEKDDEAFINMIQQVLELPDEKDALGRRLPRLRVVQGNKGIISDMETASWVKERNTDQFKPKIDITQKDFLACLKYALAAQPSFNRARQKVIRPSGPVSWNNKEKWKRKQW